jgi:hypothetical protein
MRTVLFLRIASVLTLIHAVLHTIGGVFGGAAPGPQQAAVTAMQVNQFPVMGVTRTFWDFYMGLGLAGSVSMTVEAVVFWQLSSLAKTDALRLRPVLATFLIGFLGVAVVSYRYFFVAPVIVEVLIALCLGLAIAYAKQRTAAAGFEPRAVA